MSRADLVTMMLCQLARVSEHALMRKRATTEDFTRLLAATSALDAMPISIVDVPAMSAAAIIARVRSTPAKQRPGLVVIDYLQLMQPSDHRPRYNEREHVVAVGRDTKGAAKSLGIPILGMSSVPKDVDRREDKRPMLADLYGGALEADAAQVAFLYRDDYYTHGSAGRCEVLIRKNRFGPPGMVELGFEAQHRRFYNLGNPFGDGNEI